MGHPAPSRPGSSGRSIGHLVGVAWSCCRRPGGCGIPLARSRRDRGRKLESSQIGSRACPQTAPRVTGTGPVAQCRTPANSPPGLPVLAQAPNQRHGHGQVYGLCYTCQVCARTPACASDLRSRTGAPRCGAQVGRGRGGRSLSRPRFSLNSRCARGAGGVLGAVVMLAGLVSYRVNGPST